MFPGMTVMKRTSQVLGLLLLVGGGVPLAVQGQPAGGTGIPLGIWVECEGSNRTLDSKERIDALLDRIARRGFNDLFVQVYRGGRAWYRSSLADDSPHRRAGLGEGQDPLAYILKEAHRRRVKVHAWVNLFNLAKRPQARIIAELGNEVVLRDNQGRSMLEYPDTKLPGEDGRIFQLDTPGYWLDPANPAVTGYLQAIITELLQRFPDLDGLHLDFIRYPYTLPMVPGSSYPVRVDFGYGEVGRKRFQEEVGRPEGGQPSGTRWDQWRRDQVSGFLRRVYNLSKGLRPGLLVSTAVLPWADRAYLVALQDWRGWLEEGIVDAVVVMNYTRDSRLASQVTRQALAARQGRKVLIGLGAYLMGEEPDTLRRQVAEARRLEPNGVVLFSYDAMLRWPRLFDQVGVAVPKE